MRATKKVPPLARASHWHAIWQAFVCPAPNPVHMLVRWRVRSSGEHDGWVGARARAARLPVGVAGGEGRRRKGGGGREEEEEGERRERGGRERKGERRGFAREARRRRTLRPFSEAYRAVVSMGVSGG